jgi:uncharacterized membrane protein
MLLDRKSDKRTRITYWIVTSLLVLAMITGGTAQFVQAKFNTDGFIRLGYPMYSMKIIGTWKIIGGIVLLIPGYPLVKEWAYAGFFVLLTSAVISHIAAGDVFYQWAGALTFALLTVWSWYIRPADRRLATETTPVRKQPVY